MMAADQRKKRPSNASIPSSCKTKKKKVRLLQSDINVRSSISLEWDEKKKSVVSKSNQIGITRRNFRPFDYHAPDSRNILVDVLDVPSEIFELGNLREVLSYEVWQSYLSEDERNYLKQFLPEGADNCQVVRELLAGSNFHFGNPFMNWGSSLCSGNLHPDAVIHKEKLVKEGKKEYYPELQKYHNEMIGNLLAWKERWVACKDPEKEIVHKMWRSKEQGERSITYARESKHRDAADDLEPTSDSGSWANDERAGSSDNQDLTAKPRELQKGKMVKQEKYDTFPSGPKGAARPRKGETLRKQNIYSGDGSKYMSYIKVSREQYQRIRSCMKPSSNSVPSKSLHRVLGDHYASQVKPFEHFEEEERKKLQRHWLLLASRDIPVAFANWRKRELEKRKIAQALEQEMTEKLDDIKEDEEEGDACYIISDPMEIRAENAETEIAGEVEESANSESSSEEQIDDEVQDHAIDQEVGEEENSDSEFEMIDNEAADDEPIIEDETQPLSVSTQNHLQQIQSLGSSHEMSSMHMGPDDCAILESDDIHPTITEYPETHPTLIDYPEISNGTMSGPDIAVSQGTQRLSSTNGVWVPVSMQDTYYQPTSFNQDQTLANELPLGNLQEFIEPPARLIKLEPIIRGEEIRKNLPVRQSMDGSFLNQYGNQGLQGQNELLQQFFTGQEGLPYHHQQKQPQVDFLPPSTVSAATAAQFSGYFGGQLHPSLPLDSRPKRLDDLYMHSNGQAKMFSEGSRYATPRQDNFSPVDVQNWAAVNQMNIPTPFQSQVNGGESGLGWFPAEPRLRRGLSGGWPGLDGVAGPAQTIGSRSNVDQSLFSVLSQHSNSHPGATYGSVGPTERLSQPVSYGGMGPAASNMFQQTVNPLNYLSGHETPVPVKNNGIPWMTMPSNLQDSLGKPFLKPWNS